MSFWAHLWSSGSLSQPAGLFRGKFLVLDSIRVRDYPLFVMGNVNSTLNGSVSRTERKANPYTLIEMRDLKRRRWLRGRRVRT